MHWRDLTDQAKDILEWLESPLSGRLLLLEFTVGQPAPHSRIVVTRKLFNEIQKYVLANREDFAVMEFSPNSVMLRLRVKEWTGWAYGPKPPVEEGMV